MGPIRLIQKPVNGQIVFNVPDEMRDETIIIDFQTVRKHEEKTLAEVSKDFFGKLKRPETDVNLDELSVYDQ